MLKVIFKILVGTFLSTAVFTAAAAKLSPQSIQPELLAKSDDLAIYLLKHCEETSSQSNKRVSLLNFDKAANDPSKFVTLSSWNHVLNANPTEWNSVRLKAADYSLVESASQEKNCQAFNLLNIILLRKYADWNHQHANGFEIRSAKSSVRFGQLKSIVIELKLNSARTYIPELSELKKRYAKFSTEEIITQLDHQKINLGFTLYSDESLKASAVVELDQNKLADQWIRLELTPNYFKFYSEINYQKTSKNFQDFNQLPVNGILVVGETASGNVLRHSIQPWADSIPETFKEMDFSFKKIEFVLE